MRPSIFKLFLVGLSLFLLGCGHKEEARKVTVDNTKSPAVIDVPTNTPTPVEPVVNTPIEPTSPEGLTPSSCSNWGTKFTLPSSFTKLPCSGTKLRYCLGGSIVKDVSGPEANVTLYKNQHGAKVAVSKTADNKLRGIMVEVCTSKENILTTDSYSLSISLAPGSNNNSVLEIPKVIMPGYTGLKTLTQELYYHLTIY